MSRHRKACRVILRSRADRVLLFLSHFDPGSGLDPMWVFPGGQIEAHESVEESVVRELFEETGLRLGLSEIGSSIAQILHPMEDTRKFDTGEAHFFELRVEEEFVPSQTNWTEDEVRDTVMHRWWSLDELKAESPWIGPRGAVELLIERLAK